MTRQPRARFELLQSLWNPTSINNHINNSLHIIHTVSMFGMAVVSPAACSPSQSGPMHQ